MAPKKKSDRPMKPMKTVMKAKMKTVMKAKAKAKSAGQGGGKRVGPQCMSYPVGGARRPGPRTGEILRKGLPRFGQGLAVRWQPDAHVNRSVSKIHDVLLCVGVAFFCLTMQNARRHEVAARPSEGTE